MMEESKLTSLLGTGMFVSKEIYDQRKEICKSCEFVVLRKMLCGKCLCAIPTKCAMAKTECPIKKWGKA
jgi:hypothetical protein